MVAPGCEMYVGCVDGRGVGVAWTVGSSVPGCDVGSADAGSTAIVGSLGWDSSIAKRASAAAPQRGQAVLRGGSCRPQLPQKAILPLLAIKQFFSKFYEPYYTTFIYTLSGRHVRRLATVAIVPVCLQGRD